MYLHFQVYLTQTNFRETLHQQSQGDSVTEMVTEKNLITCGLHNIHFF